MSKSIDAIIAEVEEVRRRIKSLEIQGATNVAVAAIETLGKAVKEAPDSALDEVFHRSLSLLMDSRPTEPAMLNGLLYISYFYESARREGAEPAEIKARVWSASQKYLDTLKGAVEQIIEYGWRRVPDEGVVMTHCHSSTVVKILVKAVEMGKKIEVISSETRPRYQGRITTRELAEKGVKVYHIVDSAMRWAARKFRPSMAIIGSDAIASHGTIINKIGSKLLALVAREFDFPLYVAASLLKLDPRSIFGEFIPIEMRDPAEIWPDAPEGVVVLNPAFETVAADFISALITESGIIPPQSVLYAYEKRYGEIMKAALEMQELLKKLR